MKQGLFVDFIDIFVCWSYIDMLVGKGVQFVFKSKWNNIVVVQVFDMLVIDKVVVLFFVIVVWKVWIVFDSIFVCNVNCKKEVINRVIKSNNYYGDVWWQIVVYYGDSFYVVGFCGKGMQIVVIDVGFYNVDEISVFKGMDLLGICDFVNFYLDIYVENYYGMKVLFCMVVNKLNVLVGMVFEVLYWFFCSEDDDMEQFVEEDYWVEVLEFVDSVGVDVVNILLGYYEFDDMIMNYWYCDLDGYYLLMFYFVFLVVDKGLVLVCSVGNLGCGIWKKIIFLGDVENVIIVGVVDWNLVNVDFFFVGNIIDGCVKLDVMVVGVVLVVVGNDGMVFYVNGIFFVLFILCGLVVCFWQVCFWFIVKQVVEVVWNVGDCKEYLDNIYGYGVFDIWKVC